MRFEFATANRILFGPGTLAEAPPTIREMGSRALVVTGRSARHAAPFIAMLEAAGVFAVPFAVEGEPAVGRVREGAGLARLERCDLVASIGGGSPIDAGKAIAALATNSGEPLDYLEVVGKGQPLRDPPLPFVAVPTTAGTGAEVTRNAVLTVPEHRVKASLRSPKMLARLAVVDPELTCDLPPAITAATGLDALTQLIEPYVCLRANPMTDSFCRDGMRRVARSLLRAYRDGDDRPAREDMSLASLYGGLALANAGLGAVHGFAAVVGGLVRAPHGAVCAALLAPVMRVNIRVLRAGGANDSALDRYAGLARILTGDPAAGPEDGAEWVDSLTSALGVSGLRSLGVKSSDFPALVEGAMRASSMKANPVALTADQLREVLFLAWDRTPQS